MQVLQPLAVGNICASSRNVFNVLCVQKIDFQPPNLQDLHQWNPVNSCRFHGNCTNATLLQPFGEVDQIQGERWKHTNRLWISISWYSNVNLSCTDINAGSIGVQNGHGNFLVLLACCFLAAFLTPDNTAGTRVRVVSVGTLPIGITGLPFGGPASPLS